MPGRNTHTILALLVTVFALTLYSATALAQAADGVQLAKGRELRDGQDLDALHAQAEEAERLARQNQRALASYQAALMRSWEAEVALELGDKARAAEAAEKGIELAEDAVQKDGSKAEHHRILGVLCGQIIPANLLLGVRYGACARDEIETALRLDPRSPEAYLGRGVGNYYLPESFGGGLKKAVQDFQYATSLNPKLADGWLWLGLAFRKQGNLKEARAALERAKSLAPKRIWIDKQLAKTPAQ